MTHPEQLLDAALRDARNDALEEAARVCDADVSWARTSLGPVSNVTLHFVNLAARIRALKSQEAD